MCTLLVKQVALGEFDEEETGEKKRRCQEQGDTQDDFGTQAGSHLQPIVVSVLRGPDFQKQVSTKSKTLRKY